LLGAASDHHEAIFADARPGAFRDESKPVNNRCDSVSDCFQGRGLDVHRAFQMLQTSRCVSITGVYGIGKTQVALKVAEFVAERHFYNDIFFIRLTVRRRVVECVDDDDGYSATHHTQSLRGLTRAH